MAASIDISSATPSVRPFFDGPQVTEKIIYQDHPTWAAISKDETVSGRPVVPLILAGSQGTSAVFGSAQSAATGLASENFELTPRPLYTTYSISNPQKDATRNVQGGYVNMAIGLATASMIEWTRKASYSLFRDSSAKIGSITGTFSSGVAHLLAPSDWMNFEVGQKVNAYSGATKRAGIGIVLGNNPNGDVVFADSATPTVPGAPTDWVTGDTLHLLDSKGLMIEGLGGYFPTGGASARAAALAVDFLGMAGSKRLARSQKLAGTYADYSNVPLEEAIPNAVRLTARYGGRPDYAVCHPDTWDAFANSLATKNRYERASREFGADVSFPSIEIMSQKGSVPLFADSACPPKKLHVLQLDTLKIVSYGKCPKIIKENVVVYNEDACETRLGSTGYALQCNNTSANGAFDLQA